MVTLAQLRTFATVARLNNFSRAAEVLHLTQPAVSAQVQALEEALKVQLFDRNGKKVSLSGSGRIVLDAAEELAARLAKMDHDLAQLRQAVADHLVVGASHVIGSYLLPGLLGAFKKECPGIEVGVRIESTRRIIEMLAAGETDCALIAEGVATTDKHIAVKPIIEDELVLIVPRGHVFTQLAHVQLAHLVKTPLLIPQRGSASSEYVLHLLALEGIEPELVLELGNISAVKRAVEAGLGISIVSRLAVSNELESGRLKTVPIGEHKLVRQLSLCWHHDRPISRPAEAFIRFLNLRAAYIAQAVASAH